MKNILNSFNIIFSKKEKLKLLYLSIFSIFSSFADVMSIGLLIPLINSIIDSSLNIFYVQFLNNFFSNITNENFMQFVLVAFVLLVILKNILQIIFSYILTKFLVDINQSIQNKLFVNYINEKFSNLTNIHSTNIFKNINYETGVFTNGLLSPAIVMIANFILFVVFTIFLLLYNFSVTAIIAITIIFLVLIFKTFLFKRLKNLGYMRQAFYTNYVKILKETFDIIKEIKLLRIHNYFIKLFEDNLNSLKLNSIKKAFIGSLTRPVIEIVFLLLFSLIILRELNNPENIIINLGIYTATAFRLLPSLNNLISSYQKTKNSLSCLKTIEDAIFQYDNFKNSKSIDAKISFNNTVKLKNIYIKHIENNELILDDISLNISCGKKIGIMGDSGSGKTTLLNNIIGFMKPYSGKILVDDIALENDNLIESWQKIISYVPQNVVLFDKSLLENITLSFDRELNEAEIQKYKNAISFAQLKILNEKLNKSGRTVGEMGSKISRGEAQRIGIARAIYMDCKILILDESTNFLDENTEKNFLDIIKNQMKNITVLFVSHKQKSLQICDDIYEIKNKKIERVK